MCLYMCVHRRPPGKLFLGKNGSVNLLIGEGIGVPLSVLSAVCVCTSVCAQVATREASLGEEWK